MENDKQWIRPNNTSYGGDQQNLLDREITQEEHERIQKKEEQLTLKAQYDKKKADYLGLYQAAFLKGVLKTSEHWQQAYQKANEEFIHAMRALNGIKEEES